MFQMAESGLFEIAEMLRLVLRRVRLSLRGRRSVEQRDRCAEYRQRRRVGRGRVRLEGTGENVDRETRAHRRVDRFGSQSRN